jgi:hypothetical protein
VRFVNTANASSVDPDESVLFERRFTSQAPVGPVPRVIESPTSPSVGSSRNVCKKPADACAAAWYGPPAGSFVSSAKWVENLG